MQGVHTKTNDTDANYSVAAAAISVVARAEPSALCYGWKLYPSRTAFLAAAKAEMDAMTACAKRLVAGRGMAVVEPAMDYCIAGYRSAHSLPTSREEGECDPK